MTALRNMVLSHPSGLHWRRARPEPLPESPSKKTAPTPTMESTTPATPLRVGRSWLNEEPMTMPHTGAVENIKPVLGR